MQKSVNVFPELNSAKLTPTAVNRPVKMSESPDSPSVDHTLTSVHLESANKLSKTIPESIAITDYIAVLSTPAE